MFVYITLCERNTGIETTMVPASLTQTPKRGFKNV